MFLRTMTVAVARSSYGGVAIHHVLPVFRTTSSFHTMGPMANLVSFPSGESATAVETAASVLIPTNDKDRQVHIVAAGQSLLCAIALCGWLSVMMKRCR